MTHEDMDSPGGERHLPQGSDQPGAGQAAWMNGSGGAVLLDMRVPCGFKY